MQEIMTKIDSTIDRYGMLNIGDTVVAGVSGGADSMLMLHYLMSAKDRYNLNIVVANVEHGIRGEESLRDTEFVRSFCESNNLEFKCLSIDAINESKALSMSCEEYSRLKRYEFFDSIECDKIATAHNLSDNVETVLFRLARGTSIKGCCGIPPVRGKIIRPLIECSSSDIRQYCDDNNIKYVIDSTNFNNDYSRNLIRNDIIKKFNLVNSNFEDNVSRFISSANEDYSFLDKCANETFEKAFIDDKIDLKYLKDCDVSIVKRVVIKLLSQYNVTTDEMHINAITNIIGKNSKYQIKGNVFAVSNEKYLRIANFDKKYKKVNFIVTKNVLSIDDYLKKCKLLENKFDFYCDCDKICNNIIARSRQEGDIISPANRNCTKSLKKLFNEYKIDVEKRDQVPVLCDSQGVIGVVGYCCDERVKVDSSTKNVLVINVRMEDSF